MKTQDFFAHERKDAWDHWADDLPLENEEDLERYIEARRAEFYEEWFQYIYGGPDDPGAW